MPIDDSIYGKRVEELTLEEVSLLFLACYTENIDVFNSIKSAGFNQTLLNSVYRTIGMLNYKNEHVSGEKWFLDRVLRDLSNPTVIDVGANKGAYSLLVCNSNPTANVYALEPARDTFATLQANVRDHNVTTLNVGASDKVETIKLFDYKGREGTSHATLYKDVIECNYKKESRFTEVELIILDDLIRDQKLTHIDLLKIDTEGHEYAVLQGALKSIQNGIVDTIHFEFNEMNVYSRTFFKDIYDVLPQYTFFRMLPDGLLPLGDYNPLKYELFAFQNIAAIKKDSHLLKSQ